MVDCRFGNKCNKRASCRFDHPSPPNVSPTIDQNNSNPPATKPDNISTFGATTRGRGSVRGRGERGGRDEGARGGGRGRGGSFNGIGNRGGGGESQPSKSSIRVPYGVCRDYYTTGACSRGKIGCKYEHSQTSNSNSINRDVATAGPSTSGKDYTSMAKGGSSDAWRGRATDSITSSVTIIRKIVSDESFRFSNCNEIYQFVNALQTSSLETSSWVSD
jgi:hypothetical protein